jgi:hypothetical protein
VPGRLTGGTDVLALFSMDKKWGVKEIKSMGFTSF